jgi:hypothetical protein
MLLWFWDNAMTIATVAMAVAAIAALVYAHWSISENRQAERRANANELWRETLRLAFDNPKLSDPTLRLADFDFDNCTVDGSVELFQKYEIFVDTILNASDEILGVAPSKEWKLSVRIQLLPHRDYLRSAHFRRSGYLGQYSPGFRAFVEEVLSELPRPASSDRPNVARIAAPNQKVRKRAKADHQ